MNKEISMEMDDIFRNMFLKVAGAYSNSTASYIMWESTFIDPQSESRRKYTS